MEAGDACEDADALLPAAAAGLYTAFTGPLLADVGLAGLAEDGRELTALLLPELLAAAAAAAGALVAAAPALPSGSYLASAAAALALSFGEAGLELGREEGFEEGREADMMSAALLSQLVETLQQKAEQSRAAVGTVERATQSDEKEQGLESTVTHARPSTLQLHPLWRAKAQTKRSPFFRPIGCPVTNTATTNVETLKISESSFL